MAMRLRVCACFVLVCTCMGRAAGPCVWCVLLAHFQWCSLRNFEELIGLLSRRSILQREKTACHHCKCITANGEQARTCLLHAGLVMLIVHSHTGCEVVYFALFEQAMHRSGGCSARANLSVTDDVTECDIQTAVGCRMCLYRGLCACGTQVCTCVPHHKALGWHQLHIASMNRRPAVSGPSHTEYSNHF
ncbi:hypothetical protein COO60DRAFT_1552724 [Scenedesmus sp. NREL 46B-D3]|nr:hypothetical protein COO60DRAFT_1552724 [Scenedesmus sp. NREL 46B-D3]